MAKVTSAAEAAALIGDGMTVAVDGFIGFSLAEDILCEMEERFLREGHPRDLRLVNVAGLGGDGRRRGINHFAHRGCSPGFCAAISAWPMPFTPTSAQGILRCLWLRRGSCPT